MLLSSNLRQHGIGCGRIPKDIVLQFWKCSGGSPLSRGDSSGPKTTPAFWATKEFYHYAYYSE